MEGKVIEFQAGEYPQLEGLENGSKVKMEVEATLNTEGDMMTLTFDSVEFETEGQADRTLKQMTKQDTVQAGSDKSLAGEF